MRFSICIPNFNYAKYIGRTIQSVLDQTYRDLEVIVSDNASTDGSVEVVRRFTDDRVRTSINRCNVGFANNLDRAARAAQGDVLILLSSDDVMRPQALEAYHKLYSALGAGASRAVVCSSVELIDAEDRVTEIQELPRHNVWRASDRAPELDAIAGGEVYRVSAGTLLERCLRSMQNPFFFCATAYPRELYEAVEGYGGGRLVGPDKWFHWRLLTVADEALFIKRPLFGYRWHANNQTAQQAQAGGLKYLVDGYAATLEMDAAALSRLNMTRRELEQAFVEYDVVRHGFGLLAEGKRLQARRTLRFGDATYPWHARRNGRAWVLRGLLSLGPIGTLAAARLRKRYGA